ncbi:hypothetical protein [Achromobacter denitrificans]|uniref:hypothetical protein n=1 Tax=Achromobacter denitrificans TaxID=32002 RepID=UPI003B9D6941
MTMRTVTIKEACEALNRAAEALRRTGSLFHVIAHARQSGLEDMLNTLDMAEIGIHISGEVAEQTQDWADLLRPLLGKDEVGGGSMNKAISRPNPDEARLYLDCMEEQKERLRALLSVIQDLATPLGNPDLTTLVNLAADVNEDHARWYDLRKCLGIEEESQNGGAA